MLQSGKNLGTAADASECGGDRAAFAEQFKASFRTFWYLAVAIVRDHALAEDIVQEAAIIGLEKLDQFQPGTSFKAWMSTMVRYVALNHARKEQRRRAQPLDEQQPARAAAVDAQSLRVTPGGAMHINRDLYDERIVKALDAVSDTARACLLLRTLEDMKYGEIADLLGIPEGTAMSHVHRTRQMLRQKLSDLAPARTSSKRAEA